MPTVSFNFFMNSKLPPYTAICSFYNSADFVLGIYNSISSQTHSPSAIIFVDDGSSDKTFKKIQEVAQRDSRILAITNPSNMGLAGSMNVALSCVKTIYCAKFDADDLYSRSRVELQLSYLLSNSLDLVGSWIYNSTHQSQDVVKVPEHHSDITKCSWKHIPIPHNTWVFNVNNFRIHPYNKQFSRAQDQEFLLRRSFDLAYGNVQIPLCTYRSLHNQSNRMLKLVYAFRSKLCNASRLKLTLVLSVIYYSLRILYEFSTACLTLKFTGNRKHNL